MKILREYIKELNEKRTRDQKPKRMLYHIGHRPAQPKPVSRPGEQEWRRHWLDQGVESGVFFSPNPIDIAQYHGISGDVYAYKIPEWVIAKSGGIHRYDRGSEILISEEIWEEAGDEIEFVGKSMEEDSLWDKVTSLGALVTRRSSGSKPGWVSDEEWERSQTLGSIQSDISGLRLTQHPENAIRMMTPQERLEALRAFETIDTPGKKDIELIDMIKNYIGESILRTCIRELLTESAVYPKIMSMIDKADKLGYKLKLRSKSLILYDPKTITMKGKISFAKLAGSNWDYGPCGGATMIESSFAEEGLGPLMYDVLIEATGGLISDRFSVSPEAVSVWERYMNRPDIEVIQLDDHGNTLTDKNEDNCDQEVSGGVADWIPGHTPKEDWIDNPLSKMYRKKGTPVIDELIKRNMLDDRR